MVKHRQKLIGSFFLILTTAVGAGLITSSFLVEEIVKKNLDEQLLTQINKPEPTSTPLSITTLPKTTTSDIDSAIFSQAIKTEIATQIQSNDLVQKLLSSNQTLAFLQVEATAADTSGLRLIKLTNQSSSKSNEGKVLSVDKDGNIILVDDKDTASSTTTNTTNEVELDSLFTPSAGGTLYYSGSSWLASTTLFNNGTSIGINSSSPLGSFHVTPATNSSTGLVVQGKSGQTAPLFDLLDNSGVSVASISAQGKLVLGNRYDDHSLELFPVLQITPDGDAGELSSSGGALYLDNTRNEGAGINVFSDAGAEADGHLLSIKANNPAFTKGSVYIDHLGIGNAVNITHNGSTNSGNALSITNNNTQDSALGVIGFETGRGTIKVTHTGTGSDANASGLSIDLKGSGTRAQGVYVDSTADTGTLGNLLRLRNQTIDRFVVSSTGSVSIGTTGTDTTITKRGNNANDEFFVGTNGAFRVQRSASDSEAFRVQISGDTQGRWVGTSDGKLKWGDGSTTQDTVLRRSAANTLQLDGARLQIKSVTTNSDLLTFTSSSNTRLGRFLETSGGYGWFEVSDNAAVTKIALRADSGVSYINAGNVGIGSTAAAAKLHVTSTAEQLRLSYDGTNQAQFAVGSSGLLTVTPTAGMSVASSLGIGTTSFGTSAANVLAIANSTAPASAVPNGAQLFAVDQAGSHELRVMDEAGNVTTLSPHNFSLIPEGRSETLAWSFYSERQGLAVNADITRALRVIENLSGEQLIFIKDLETNQYIEESLTKPETGEGNFLGTVITSEQLEIELENFVTKQEQNNYISFKDGVVTFIKNVTFSARTLFTNLVEFSSQVIFKDILTVSENTAGKATIPPGATSVKIKFSKPYPTTPQVYLSAQTSKTEYELEEVTTDGFIVNLLQPHDESLIIDWFAVIAEGDSEVEILQTSTATPSPSPSPEIEVTTPSTSSAITN